MLNIGVIPFRFGSAASECVSKKLLEFYLWLADCVAASNHSLNEKQSSNALSLALTLEESQQDAGNAYLKLTKFVEPWISSVRIVVVDLLYHGFRVRPGRIEQHICTSLIGILGEQEGLDRIIVLVPNLPPQSSTIHRILAQYLNTRIILVSESGETSLDNAPSSFSKNEYLRRLTETSESPLELLKLKMITKRGHYKLQDFSSGDSGCIAAIFDCSNASSELAALFTTLLENWSLPTGTEILFHTVFSTWLDEPIRAAAQSLGLRCTAFQKRKIINGTETYVIAVPLLDTRATVSDLIKAVRNDSPSANIYVLTALSTQGEAASLGTLHLSFSTGSVEVKYVLKVDRRRADEECLQCKLNQPFADMVTDHYQLGSFTFWQMVRHWHAEPMTEVPPGRDPLPQLPDFTAIIKENGAWLAAKMRALITLFGGADFFLSKPYLVVCPEEEAARSLALFFEVFKGFTVVRVPRVSLNAITDNNTISDLKDEIWCQRIRTAPEDSDVILLEEFSLSGKTKTALAKAVALAGREARFHVAIVDFGNNAGIDSQIKSMALYRIPLV